MAAITTKQQTLVNLLLENEANEVFFLALLARFSTSLNLFVQVQNLNNFGIVVISVLFKFVVYFQISSLKNL